MTRFRGFEAAVDGPCDTDTQTERDVHRSMSMCNQLKSQVTGRAQFLV